MVLAILFPKIGFYSGLRFIIPALVLYLLVSFLLFCFIKGSDTRQP